MQSFAFKSDPLVGGGPSSHRSRKRALAVAAACVAAGALAALAVGRVTPPVGSALVLEASLGPAVVALDIASGGLTFRLAVGASGGTARLP